MSDHIFKAAYGRSHFLQQVFQDTVYDPGQRGYQAVDEHEFLVGDAAEQGQRQQLTKEEYLLRQKTLYDRALEAAAAAETPVQLGFKSEKVQSWRVDYSLLRPNENCVTSPINLGDAQSVYECAIKTLLEEKCGVGSVFATNAFKGTGECSCQAPGTSIGSSCQKFSGSTYSLHPFGRNDWGTFGAGYHPCAGEGVELTSGGKLSKSQCQDLCTADTRCNGYSWNSVDYRCYLKAQPEAHPFCLEPKTCAFQNWLAYDWKDAEEWHFIYNYRGCLNLFNSSAPLDQTAEI